MMILPLASSPWTWNTDLAISRPIVIACTVDGLLRWFSTDLQLGTSDAVRGPSTQHCEERSDAAISIIVNTGMAIASPLAMTGNPTNWFSLELVEVVSA